MEYVQTQRKNVKNSVKNEKNSVRNSKNSIFGNLHQTKFQKRGEKMGLYTTIPDFEKKPSTP